MVGALFFDKEENNVRAALSILSVAVGALLLLPAVAVVRGGPAKLRPSAFQPVLRIPLKALDEKRNLAFMLMLPSSEEIGASDLNDHRYLITAAVSERLAHCWNELGIRVSAKIADRSLAVQNAQGAPYGWSTKCAISGVWFSAPASEQVELIIEAGSTAQFSGELMVLPFLSGVKDRLVLPMVHDDIVKLSWFTTPVAVLLIAGGVVSFRRKAFRS